MPSTRDIVWRSMAPSQDLKQRRANFTFLRTFLVNAGQTTYKRAFKTPSNKGKEAILSNKQKKHCKQLK